MASTTFFSKWPLTNLASIMLCYRTGMQNYIDKLCHEFVEDTKVIKVAYFTIVSFSCHSV